MHFYPFPRYRKRQIFPLHLSTSTNLNWAVPEPNRFLNTLMKIINNNDYFIINKKVSLKIWMFFFLTISIRLLTKYTVVALDAASISIAVPGLMKWDTSAICTPTSNLSSSIGRQCRASSISVHPGGSTEHMSIWRRSTLLLTSYKIHICPNKLTLNYENKSI